MTHSLPTDFKIVKEKRNGFYAVPIIGENDVKKYSIEGDYRSPENSEERSVTDERIYLAKSVKDALSIAEKDGLECLIHVEEVNSNTGGGYE